MADGGGSAGKVVLDVTVSLDGFIAERGVGVERPMGETGLEAPRVAVRRGGGRGVHRDRAEGVGVGWGGRDRQADVRCGGGVCNDTPFAAPCFVLTHEKGLDERVEGSGTFVFVTDVQTALGRAREAAGEGCVRLMRAEVSRRFLEADLIDQIRIQVAPMLLGAGTRLFDSPGSGPIELRRKRVVKSPRVTHLWLDVAKRSRKGVRRGVGPVGAKGRCSRGGCRRPP